LARCGGCQTTQVIEGKSMINNVLVIEAGRTERNYWRDIWRYRELFFFLAWRDILVRYKQTVIGISWALIRPVLTMIVFTVIFGKIAALPSSGTPYPILVFVAMLPWQFVSGAVTEASTSLIANANLVSKVYFPRVIMPASSIMTSLVDFIIAAAVLCLLMLWYQVSPDWRLLTLPYFLLLATATALGSGLWLAALNVRYRDFRYVVPFLIQLGLYVSPVGFSSAVVMSEWRMLYSVNPMVGIIDGFRWALLRGSEPLYLPGTVVSTVAAIALLLHGIAYFRRVEKSFADVI
jgi:lipopolysaccharide transport system permease protein